MKRRTGFTLIELMIVIVIMAILMVLAVINLRSTQPNSRDASRASDVATIARGLEQRYSNALSTFPDSTPVQVFLADGNCTGSSTKAALSAGSYPSVMEINYVKGATDSTTTFCPATPPGNFLTEDLPGTDAGSFTAPNGGQFVPATATGTPSSATIGDNFVYQPLTATGALCSNLEVACTKFTIYYNSETGSNPVTVTSKHQQ